MIDAKISKMEPQISKKGWAGARPNSGGTRLGVGRKRGTPYKVTAEVKELARQYGPEAIAVAAPREARQAMAARCSQSWARWSTAYRSSRGAD